MPDTAADRHTWGLSLRLCQPSFQHTVLSLVCPREHQASAYCRTVSSACQRPGHWYQRTYLWCSDQPAGHQDLSASRVCMHSVHTITLHTHCNPVHKFHRNNSMCYWHHVLNHSRLLLTMPQTLLSLSVKAYVQWKCSLFIISPVNHLDVSVFLNNCTKWLLTLNSGCVVLSANDLASNNRRVCSAEYVAPTRMHQCHQLLKPPIHTLSSLWLQWDTVPL